MRVLPFIPSAALLLGACVGPGVQPSHDVAPAESLTIELRLADTVPAPGRVEAMLPESGEKIYLRRTPVLTSSAFSRVEATAVPEGLRLSLYLTPEGAHRLAEITGRNLGQRLALLVGGRALIAPRIVVAIQPTTMQFQAFAPLPESQARVLAERLSSGT